MRIDFEQMVNREGIGNMKGAFLPVSCSGKAPLVLAGAEMDFPTAPVIRKVLSAFAERGLYGFTLPEDAYLSAVREWMKAERGISISKEDIVPAMGTIFALSTAVRAFTDPGEGVIILYPSYYRHDRAVIRNDRKIVSCGLKCQDGRYALDSARLREALSAPQNRLLVLCNPHNPTGHVFSKEELQGIAAMARETDTIIFSDEIFAEISRPEHPVLSMVSLLPELSLACTSLGKAFNFTGVNQSNVLIPDKKLRERYITQRDRDHFGSIDPFFYQALIAAYSPEGSEWLKAIREQVFQNADLLAKLLPREISLSPVEGGYIAWLDVSRAGRNGDEFSGELETEEAVLVDPGSEYGEEGENHIRVNLATSHRTVEEFASRVKHLLSDRKGNHATDQ